MTVLVRSASMTRYSEIARGAGLDPVRIVSKAGLDRACLYTPELRIPQPSCAEVLEESSRSIACHSLGLMVGESWRLSDFGPASLLLQHEPTLRHALAEIERYRHWFSDSVSIQLAEHPESTVLYVTLQTGPNRPGRQSVELTVAVLCCLIRSILGAQWKPQRVHFSHAAPVDLQIHRRLFGQRIEFRSGFDGLVLARGDLDSTNPLADANLAVYAREFLELQSGANGASFGADVRRTLHQLLPRGRGAIEQVAQSLGVSPRTLQRQLEQDGETFSALVNVVRRDLAVRFLRDTQRPISQAATALGFSEPSGFSRWFAAQFGKTPTRWRQDGV